METRDHRSSVLPERHEPSPLPFLRRRRHHEIESVRQLLEDNDRPREQLALAINFRADVLADARPPYVPFRNVRRLVRRLVQVAL